MEAQSNGKSVMNGSETMTAAAVYGRMYIQMGLCPQTDTFVVCSHASCHRTRRATGQSRTALHYMLSHSHLEVSTSNAETVLADTLHHGLTTDFLQHQISSSGQVWRRSQVTHKLTSLSNMPSSQRTDYWV